MVVWDFWTINSMMSSKFAALFSTSILTFLHLFYLKTTSPSSLFKCNSVAEKPKGNQHLSQWIHGSCSKTNRTWLDLQRNNLMLGRSRVIKNMCGWIFGWLEVSTIMMNTNMENKQKSTFNKFVVFFFTSCKEVVNHQTSLSVGPSNELQYPSSDLTFSGCFPQTFLIDSKSSLLQQGENLIT